jgi:hypothetical protein
LQGLHRQEEWPEMRVYYDRDADVNLVKGKKVLALVDRSRN